MDPQSLQWLLGIIITVLLVVIGALCAAFMTHMRECRDFRERFGALESDVKNLKERR